SKRMSAVSGALSYFPSAPATTVFGSALDRSWLLASDAANNTRTAVAILISILHGTRSDCTQVRRFLIRERCEKPTLRTGSSPYESDAKRRNFAQEKSMSGNSCFMGS